MATKKSELIVSLIDRLSGPARGVGGALDRLTAAQARNNQRLDAMRGRMLEAGAVAYGLARSLSAPIRAATEFETKLEDIAQKIDAPVEALPELGRKIRQVARDTTQSASAIADGMDVLTGMGASGDDALGLLGPIAKAATAYNASITDLSQAGYAALDNLKVPAEDFGKALDAMAQAGKAGAFELKDMAQYFPALGAGYQALGQTGVPAVADLSAALQIVRKGTGDSASAATNLSNVLQKMRAPKTVKAFKAMGVNLEQELKRAAEAGLTPIEAIAEITNKTLKGDLSKLGYLFADAETQKGLRPLLQNLDLYREIRAEAMKAQGVVEEDYRRRLLTGALAAQRFAIALENVNTSIGAALLPAMAQLGEKLVPIIDRMATFAENNPRLTQTVVALTAGLVGLRVAAIAAQFGLLWMKGGVISAAIAGLTGLKGALGIAGLAITPITAAFRGLRSAVIGYTASAAIIGRGGAMKLAASSMLGMLNPVRLLSGAFRGLKIALVGSGIGLALLAVGAAGMFIYNQWTGISTAFEAFKGAFMRAIEPVMPALQPAIDGFQWLWDKVSNLLGPIDELGGGWASAGIAVGKFVGEAIVAIVELPGKIIALAGEFYEAGKKLGQAIYDGIAALIEKLASYISSKLSGALSSVGNYASGLASRVGSYIGLGGGEEVEARASGGPVRSGRPYLIGERGPELMVPNRNGLVVPNHMLNGGGGASASPAASSTTNTVHAPISVTVYATTNASADDIGRVVGSRVRDVLDSSFSDGGT